MVQLETKRLPFNRGGFTIAALIAPGMAVAIFYLAVGVAGSSVGPGDIGRLIVNFPVVWLIVSVWGVLPSLIFGGLVLAIIRRIPWRGRPTMLVFTCGGAVAAGLYVLTGLGTASLSPHMAMLFAPWATSDLSGGGVDEGRWLVVSLLLAGAGAGLIYAAIDKRG